MPFGAAISRRARRRWPRGPPRGEPSARLDPEEVRAFLSRADEDEHAALWRLMLSTGLRRGELLGLWWDDVDLEERSLRVRRQVLLRGRSTNTAPRLYLRETTKGRRPRTVRIDAAARDALKAWKATQAEDRLNFGPTWRADGGLGQEAAWVATESDEKVIHPDTLHDRFERIAKGAGVRRLPCMGLATATHDRARFGRSARSREPGPRPRQYGLHARRLHASIRRGRAGRRGSDRRGLRAGSGRRALRRGNAGGTKRPGACAALPASSCFRW
jgi:Phage integrase family